MTTTCDLAPFDDRVVIKPEKDEMTAGGIALPDSAKEKPLRGVVLAVGPGKRDERALTHSRFPMTVKVGDEVYFSRYGSQQVERDGKTFVVARESDLLARVEKAAGW